MFVLSLVRKYFNFGKEKMKLSTEQLNSIHSALYARETQILELLKLPFYKDNPAMMSKLQTELALIPQLKNDMLEMWLKSFGSEVRLEG